MVVVAVVVAAAAEEEEEINFKKINNLMYLQSEYFGNGNYHAAIYFGKLRLSVLTIKLIQQRL